MIRFLFEKFMKLALPVVFSMMVSLIYNMVDTYFIAMTGVQDFCFFKNKFLEYWVLMKPHGNMPENIISEWKTVKRGIEICLSA